MEDKLFLVFGLAAVICGIALVTQQQYVIGIGGTVAGAWVVFKNINKIRAKKAEEN